MVRKYQTDEGKGEGLGSPRCRPLALLSLSKAPRMKGVSFLRAEDTRRAGMGVCERIKDEAICGMRRRERRWNGTMKGWDEAKGGIRGGGVWGKWCWRPHSHPNTAAKACACTEKVSMVRGERVGRASE